MPNRPVKPMTPEEKQTFYKCLAIDHVCILIAIYLILGANDSALLRDMNLPVLVEGDNGFYAGIAVLIVGTFPLLRFLLGRNVKTAAETTTDKTEA